MPLNAQHISELGQECRCDSFHHESTKEEVEITQQVLKIEEKVNLESCFSVGGALETVLGKRLEWNRNRLSSKH